MVNLQRGHDITRSIQRPGPIPVVSSSGISSYHNEAKAKGPGVILGRKGTLGKTYFVAGDYWPHDTTLWTTDFKGNDPRFIYYFFLNQDFRVYDVGSSNPTLNRNHVHALPALCPPIAVQRRIAGVLGALDDLIDTNKRLADCCAHLRRAIVDQALLEATGSSPLSTFASFVNGKNFTKDASGTGRPIIRTPELRRGPTEGTVWSDAEVDPEYLARRGDILFVWSGSLMVDRWLHQDALVNQHIFKVTPFAGVPDWLVFGLIEFQMPWFLGLAADKATTMGHIQRGHLYEAVPVLAAESLNHLDSVVQPLWDQELESRAEAIELARTRDELLPLLLSGAVTVAEVAA